MKWLGQYVQSFTARFRSDVYLEDISSGTIVSGGHLGLDSNDKIVKAVDGGGDLTSIVAGAGMTGASLTGPIPTLNVISGDGITVNANDVAVRTAQSTITSIYNTELKVGNTSADSLIAFNTPEKIAFVVDGDEQIALQDGVLSPKVNNDVDLGKEDFRWKDIYANGTVYSAGGFNGNLTGNASGTAATVTAAVQPNIESIGTDGDTLSILGDKLLMVNTTANYPWIDLQNQTNDASGPILSFTNDRVNTSTQPGLDEDILGRILFYGYNDGTPAVKAYSQIISRIADATTGQEAGRLDLQVAQFDGTNITGLKLDGDTDADGEIDVTIGAGTASTTAIAGTLTVANNLYLGTDEILLWGGGSNHNTLKNINAVDAATSSTITSVLNSATLNKVYIDADINPVGGAGMDIGYQLHLDASSFNDAGTAASGTIARRNSVNFEIPTFTSTNATTTTDAATLYIQGAPVGGTNLTVTNPYALWVDAGDARFDGDVDVDGTLEVDAFKGTGSTTVTNILDEDAMGSNSATALSTQQSIKAYADTKRPNLYWFGVCDEATAAGNANLGAFPSTDVSIVSFLNTTLTNDTDVFTLDTDEVTITRAGVYKFTYNVLLEIGGGANRTEGAIGILKNDGSSVTLVEGSRSSTYNRFAAGDVSRTAGSVSMFIDVAVDDIFYIGFFKEAHQTSNTRLQTVPSGTTWTIEAVT